MRSSFSVIRLAVVTCVLVSALAGVAHSQSSLKVDGRPPIHVDDELFTATLSGFHRLLNAIEIGTTLVDYRRELLDAKTVLDPLLADFPESHQRTDLEEALRDYMIAANVWQAGIEYGDGIPTKTDFYRSLRTRYELKLEPKMGRKVNDDALLRFVWGIAAARLDHSIKIQKATQ